MPTTVIILTVVDRHNYGRILLHIYPLIDNKTFNFLILKVLQGIFLSKRVILKEVNGYGMLSYFSQ